jgi:serine/threonine-protein kinase RsbW
MDEFEDVLELDSSLAELSRAWPWAEGLADRHRLSDETRYAIQLCLEEALANVVLHGYGNQPGHPIVIRSSLTDGWLLLAIEDEAATFAPVEPASASEVREPASLESIQPGGNGIKLMRKFAGSVKYEPVPKGNRLVLGFPLSQAAGVISAQSRTA